MTVRKRVPLFAAVLGLTAALGLPAANPVGAQSSDRKAHQRHEGQFPTPFKHVVVIFQENRTPDNLFQGLCYPPFGESHSCSNTPTARQYNISTGGCSISIRPPG